MKYETRVEELVQNIDPEQCIQLFELITQMLNAPQMVEEETVEPLLEYREFKTLYRSIADIRELSQSLYQGDLKKFVYSRGYILSNLKALQSNLRHLTWQTEQIAKGDFSQKVDFLGDFSKSFNQMAVKLNQSNEHLKHLANIDALTQIPNRMALTNFISLTFQKAKQTSEGFSILLFDLDFFKKVNDTYGHSAGDKVLMSVSALLKNEFRISTDVFARYGGEEFLAVLPNVTLEQAIAIGERCLKVIRETPVVIDSEISLKVTISAGAASYRAGDKNFEEIINRSDDALYAAKHKGRDCLCYL